VVVPGPGSAGTTTAAVLAGTGFSTTVLSLRTVQAVVPSAQATTARRAIRFIGFLHGLA